MCCQTRVHFLTHITTIVLVLLVGKGKASVMAPFLAVQLAQAFTEPNVSTTPIQIIVAKVYIGRKSTV